jgi:hypothetical protein
MYIDLPPVEQERLSQIALAAGFNNVSQYLTHHVIALAHEYDEAKAVDSIELQASVRTCQQSMKAFDNDQGMRSNQVRQKLAGRLAQGE